MPRLPAFYRFPLTTLLLAAGTIAAFFLLGGADSPVFRWTGLDFQFLLRPLTLGGGLLFLSRLVFWARSTDGALRLVKQLARGREQASYRRLRTALPVLQRLLADSGLAVLALGLLASVYQVPVTISGHPNGPDLGYLRAYLTAFHSLAAWGIFFLAPFLVLRAVSEIRTSVSDVLKVPWLRLIGLGTAFVLLAEGGILSAAFGIFAPRVLMGLGLVLGLSYGAGMLRNAAQIVPQGLPQLTLRSALMLLEVSWVAVMLATVAVFLEVMGPGLIWRDGVDAQSAAAYLETLDSLTYWALVFLIPFAAVRVAGIFWPVLDRILGFPMMRLVLLAVGYLFISENGVLPTALEIPASQMAVALTVALAISYAGSVLWNVAGSPVPGRFGPSIGKAAGLLSSVAVAAAPAVVVWAGLSQLPVISAALLDHPETSRFGELSLPHFGKLFDTRYVLASLCLATGLVFSLPKAVQSYSVQGHRVLMVSASYTAIGCLAWFAGSGLVDLGHGFALVGGTVAAGMFSLAIVGLAAHAAPSSDHVLAHMVNWFAASNVRAFVLGAAVAFYVLLMRPVLYEMLWFAALFEYLALLVFLLLVLVRIMNRMRLDYRPPDAGNPMWTGWSHHRQVLETKADPRSELTLALRQRFVEDGDWMPLWKYMMGLLYRKGVTFESMQAVCQPLCRSTTHSLAWNILGRERRNRSRRLNALKESLSRADQALASLEESLQTIQQSVLRAAADSFIEMGKGSEPFAIALMTAQCQRGGDLEHAVEKWYAWMNASASSSRWPKLPWPGRDAKARDIGDRRRLVEGAIEQLFGEGPYAMAASSASPA